MYNDEEKICRLCLTKSEFSHGKCEDMESNSIYLEKLFLQMNLSISENPIMCCLCSRNLKKAYEFKSSCLEIERRIKTYCAKSNCATVDLRELYANEIVKNKNRVFSDVEGVCRFCLGYIKDDKGISLDIAKENITLIKDVLPKFLPELNFSIASDPIVCMGCIKSMQRYFGFWRSCCEVEEKIDMYCQSLDMNLDPNASQIKLTDVVGFIAENLMGNSHSLGSHPQITGIEMNHVIGNSENTSSPLLMKTEVVEEEVVEETIDDMDVSDGMELVKKEKEVEVKCEEKYIKEQSDNESFEDEQPIPLTTSNSKSQEPEDNPIGIKDGNKSNGKIPKGKYIRIRHRCTECDFKSRFKRCLTLHMRTHSKKTYGCGKCEFTTADKSDMEIHMQSHEVSHKQRHDESSPNSPLRTYKSTRDKPMFICHTCGYQTKQKIRLQEHIHNHESGTLFKCVLCPFESSVGRQFKNHMKDHPKVSTKKVKCPQDLVILKDGDKLTLVCKKAGDGGGAAN